MRFKLLIEYAGTRYSGWQIQKNARTVQGEIDRAVGEVSGRRDFELYGSGRTDAGVHALAQVAHLDLATPLSPEDVVAATNDKLPADINILGAVCVPHRFHARHDAVARSYVYQIARRRTAFAKPYVWWVKEDIDVALMRQAAARFSGMHDFQAFTDADPDETSTAVQVERVQVEDAGDLLLVRVEGSHFIWKMVRRMIGVLVEVGRGRLTPARVTALLQSPSKLSARITAPASGLFLERVFYAGDRRDYPLAPPLFALPAPDTRR
jgi:tRNA pseudouridine38-40 synthase